MRPLLDQSHLDVAWHAGQYQALPPVYVQNSALEIAWTRVVEATGTREGRMLAPFLTRGPRRPEHRRRGRLRARGAADRLGAGAARPCRARAVSWRPVTVDRSTPPNRTTASGVADAGAFEEAQRDVFDDVARRYDNRWLRSTWPRNVDARVATIERILAPSLAGLIVEIGCGTGQIGELLVERNPDLRYVGLDLSGPMLDIARGRMDRFGARVELRQVHGALGLEPDTYDGAFGVDVLHHVERPAVVLGEVCEALAPGGQMVFLEGNPRFPVTALLGIVQRHERGLLRISRRSLTSWASTAGFDGISTSWGPTYTPPAPARDRTCARPRRRPLRAGAGSEDVGAPHRRGRAQASPMTDPSHEARRVRPRKGPDVRREAAQSEPGPCGSCRVSRTRRRPSVSPAGREADRRPTGRSRYRLVRAGVILCAAAATLVCLTRFDQVMGLYDWRADRNDAQGYLERLYGDDGVVRRRRVVEEARARMPEDARYRVVVGPRLGEGNRFTSVVVAEFLDYFLLPRRQVDDVSADWAFCYGCDTASAREAVRAARRRRKRGLVRAARRMTVRAIAGLLLFDLALVATGLALLYGLRGLRSWMDALRLAGLAFLLGFSSVATVLTALLALGIPFGPVTVTAACLSVVAVGAVLGIVTGRPRPFDAPPRPRLPRLSLVSALFVAAFALYFEALFRATRLAAQSEWDAWRCWSIRPKAIWFFDGFDTQLFGAGAPRCPGYPPGLATIEASAFEAMGSVDVVTYTLQSWVLALAFVGAVAGLLAPRVRGLLLLPFLLLAVVLPSVTDRIADGRADPGPCLPDGGRDGARVPLAGRPAVVAPRGCRGADGRRHPDEAGGPAPRCLRAACGPRRECPRVARGVASAHRRRTGRIPPRRAVADLARPRRRHQRRAARRLPRVARPAGPRVAVLAARGRGAVQLLPVGRGRAVGAGGRRARPPRRGGPRARLHGVVRRDRGCSLYLGDLGGARISRSPGTTVSTRLSGWWGARS